MTITRMRGAAIGAALTVGAALTAACGGNLTYPTDVKVLPVAANFAVDSYATFLVRNETRQTIHVDRCGTRVQAGLDRRVGGEWQNEMAAVCILSYYTGPLALAPGESVTDSVLIRSPGTFRVFVGYGSGNQDILYLARSGGFSVQ